MPQGSTTDVLICGAGAAGLTLAIDLARRGVAFRLIEKSAAPFHGSRGKGIQPRSQEVFEDLGVVDRLFAAGGPYPPQREYRADGSFVDLPIIVAQEPSTPPSRIQSPLMVPQFLTEAVLRERLAELGHGVEFGCELVGVHAGRGAASPRGVAGAKGKETIRARYLVGADGGRSFVRQALGIDFPGKTLGVRAIVADVMLDGVGRDAWHRWGEGGQSDLAMPAGRHRPVPAAGASSAGGRYRSFGRRARPRWSPQRTGRRDIVVRSVSWASAYHDECAHLPIAIGSAASFLAGDAAHIHPPTGGQGLNTSVQDAYNLGWKLAAVLRGAPDTLLATYEEERRPIAAEMLGLTTGLLEAAKQGSMRRGREVHQLDIGYPQLPRWRWRRRDAAAASSLATARRMRRCAVPRACRRACSRCSKGRTGLCWDTASRTRGRRAPPAPAHPHRRPARRHRRRRRVPARRLWHPAR